jgi:hypothetical protein
VDEPTLSAAELYRTTTLKRQYIANLRKRGQFTATSLLRYTPRQMLHLLLLRDALHCSVHLKGGTRNGKNDRFLEQMLQLLDELIDHAVHTGKVPQCVHGVQRDSATRTETRFDLGYLVENRLMPLAP